MTAPPPIPQTSTSPHRAAKQVAFLPAVCAGVLIALIGVVSTGGVAVLINESDGDDSESVTASAANADDSRGTAADVTDRTDIDLAIPATNSAPESPINASNTEITTASQGDTSADTDNTAAAATGPPLKGVPNAQTQAASTTPESIGAGTPSAALPVAPPEPRPLDEVRARRNVLPISTDPSYQHRLCRLDDVAPDELDLTLEASQFDGPGSPTITLQKAGTAEEPAWEAVRANQSGSSRSAACGQFTFANHELIWTWHPDADRDLMPFCLLHVVAKTKNVTDAELCQLWRPEEHDGVALQFAEIRAESRLLPDVRVFPLPQNFEMEIDLVGYPSYRLDGSQSLSFEEQSDIVILSPDDDTQELLHLRVSFRGSEKRLSMLVEPQADMPVQSPRRKSDTNQTRMQPFRRADAGRHRNTAEKGIQEADSAIEALERSIDALEDQLQLAPNNQAINQRLIATRQKLAEAEDARAKLEKLLAWAEGVDQLCTILEQNARITCRLVRRTDDGRLVNIVVPSARLLQQVPAGGQR